MRVIGTKILKNRLSEYVRLAAGGETILVTDRDKFVAELVPAGAGRATTVSDAMLADLVREGVITPALMRSPLPPPPPPVMSFKELMEQLEADRQDR